MCGSKDFKIKGRRLNTNQGKNPKKKIGIATTICQCKNCSLIFSNPIPIPHDWNDHYGVPPESYWKEQYFKEDHSFFANEIATFNKIVGIKPGMKALDIGAGIGKGMKSLAKAGFDVWGVEPSLPFWQRAIEKMGIPEDRIQCCTGEEADFPDNTFDFITLSAVLEHVVNPDLLLRHIIPMLNSNGLLHIEVPHAHWMIPRIFNTYFRLIGTDYTTHLSPMHTPYHLYEFGKDTFEANAKRVGYKVAHCDILVCSTFMPKVFNPILRPWMKANNSGMQLSIWLKKA